MVPMGLPDLMEVMASLVQLMLLVVSQVEVVVLVEPVVEEEEDLEALFGLLVVELV